MERYQHPIFSKASNFPLDQIRNTIVFCETCTIFALGNNMFKNMLFV